MLAKEKAFSDAHHYRVTKESEANQKRYTPNYLKYVLYQSLSNNSILIFGDSIPKVLLDQIKKETNIIPIDLENK